MNFKKKSSGISSKKDQLQTLSITNSFTKEIYCITLVRSWPGEQLNFLSPDPIKLVISEFDYIQVNLITLSNVYKLSSCKYFNCTEDSLAIIFYQFCWIYHILTSESLCHETMTLTINANNWTPDVLCLLLHIKYDAVLLLCVMVIN